MRFRRGLFDTMRDWSSWGQGVGGKGEFYRVTGFRLPSVAEKTVRDNWLQQTVPKIVRTTRGRELYDSSVAAFLQTGTLRTGPKRCTPVRALSGNATQKVVLSSEAALVVSQLQPAERASLRRWLHKWAGGTWMHKVHNFRLSPAEALGAADGGSPLHLGNFGKKTIRRMRKHDAKLREVLGDWGGFELEAPAFQVSEQKEHVSAEEVKARLTLNRLALHSAWEGEITGRGRFPWVMPRPPKGDSPCEEFLSEEDRVPLKFPVRMRRTLRKRVREPLKRRVQIRPLRQEDLIQPYFGKEQLLRVMSHPGPIAHLVFEMTMGRQLKLSRNDKKWVPDLRIAWKQATYLGQERRRAGISKVFRKFLVRYRQQAGKDLGKKMRLHRFYLDV